MSCNWEARHTLTLGLGLKHLRAHLDSHRTGYTNPTTLKYENEEEKETFIPGLTSSSSQSLPLLGPSVCSIAPELSCQVGAKDILGLPYNCTNYITECGCYANAWKFKHRILLENT